MNIYVGNLPHTMTETQLREAFEAHGGVSRASVTKDKLSGLPRGFGFVEMPEQGEARAAISALHGQDFGGKTLRVNEARPRDDRPHTSNGTVNDVLSEPLSRDEN